MNLDEILTKEFPVGITLREGRLLYCLLADADLYVKDTGEKISGTYRWIGEILANHCKEAKDYRNFYLCDYSIDFLNGISKTEIKLLKERLLKYVYVL